jgi:hypothetical protein
MSDQSLHSLSGEDGEMRPGTRLTEVEIKAYEPELNLEADAAS